MRFVTGYGNKTTGFPRINLDHVATLRSVKENNKWGAFDCYTSGGEKLGRISGYELECETKPSGLVPETGRAVLVSFFLDSDGSVFADRVPIVAWAVYGGSAEPITCELPPSHPYVIEFQNPKRWIAPEDCSFDDFESAANWAREELLTKKQHDAARVAELEKVPKTPEVDVI